MDDPFERLESVHPDPHGASRAAHLDRRLETVCQALVLSGVIVQQLT